MPNGIGGVLKGIGKAIGRGVKKGAGYVHREVIIPEYEHIRGKFTEPVVSKPTVRRKTLPGSAALSKAFRTTVEPYKAEERTTKATRPGGVVGGRRFPSGAVEGAPTGLKRGEHAPHTVEPFKAQQRTKLKRTPGATRPRVKARYKTAGGAKAVPIPRPGETLQSASYKSRIAKEQAAERKAAREAAVKPRVGKGPTTTTALTAGVARGNYVEVIGRVSEPERRAAPTVKGMTKAKPKRKFSAKRTTKTLGEAARASQKEIEIDRLDTTAQDVARMMTEQEMAREAQRTESELKEDRRPRREKARYRYQTRGYKRSEGRGR